MAIFPPMLHSHTTLESRDIERSLRLYHDVLGLSTGQQLDKVGLLAATNGHIAAIIQLPKPSAQPYWNYYARPVPVGSVDTVFDAVRRVADAHEITALREPARETRFGIDTYGFSFCDRDGNWWRIEENNGPFGALEIPAVESASAVPAGPIGYVTLESADIAATAAFYRDFLGLNVVERDGAIHSHGAGGVNLVTVPVQGELLAQPMLNHHGLTLEEGDRAGVDAAFAAVHAHGAAWGVRKAQPITDQHGSYQFYVQDRDTNWWEIETLSAGLNPWQRISNPPGSPHLLDPRRGSNTIRRPYREAEPVSR